MLIKRNRIGWFSRFIQAAALLASAWLVGIIIQGIGRFYLFFHNITKAIYQENQTEISLMFQKGLIFDIRTVSIIFGGFLPVIGLLALSQRCFAFWQRISPVILTLLTAIITWLTLTNIFYYFTFQRSIDLFIFGLIDDDTTAILQTLWNDYPVVRGLLAMLLAISGFYWLYTKLRNLYTTKISISLHWSWATLATLLLFALTFIGMRGSVDTFPLRRSDVQVSNVTLLNMLVPNGPISLSWAYKDYKNSTKFSAATDQEGEEILNQFFGHPVNPSLAVFSAKTKTNSVVENNPPHVILSLMESMGTHLFNFDAADRDLLGKLRPHWDSDWRYSRFIAEGEGTIDSLSRLLIRSPYSNISQSTAQSTDFISNMLKPYLAQGYKVIFITSGNGAWQNLNQFLPRLGVSEFIEQNSLKEHYPDAKASAWGVPDEYLFAYMQKRLLQAEQNKEHLLIITLSTVNHPPYSVPENYDGPTFHLSPAESQRLANLGNDDKLIKVLQTFRYSNDQLGKFISWVKQQPLGQHTIIAATGDHNMRGIGYQDQAEQVLGHGVPFYLYVPKDYQQGSVFDPTRVGSHKDIWPTLYQLSLSNTDYYQTGCDLLAGKLDPNWCFGYNKYLILTQQGAYLLKHENSFKPWADDLLLANEQTKSAEQQRYIEQKQAMTPLLEWQLSRQVNQQP